MQNENALNVIGRTYNSDAVMLGNAFEYVYRNYPGNYEKLMEYVKLNATDKRFTIHILSASSNWSSLIVKYRNKRYYIYGAYNSLEKSRTFYVYAA